MTRTTRKTTQAKSAATAQKQQEDAVRTAEKKAAKAAKAAEAAASSKNESKRKPKDSNKPPRTPSPPCEKVTPKSPGNGKRKSAEGGPETSKLSPNKRPRKPPTNGTSPKGKGDGKESSANTTALHQATVEQLQRSQPPDTLRGPWCEHYQTHKTEKLDQNIHATTALDDQAEDFQQAPKLKDIKRYHLDHSIVFSAVASVWSALHEVGTHFATIDSVGAVDLRTRDTSQVPNLRFSDGHTFILPLGLRQMDSHWEEYHVHDTQGQIQPEQKDLDKLKTKDIVGNGHILLVVANKLPPNRDVVSVTYYDSLPGTYTPATIRWAALQTLRRSRWLTDISYDFTNGENGSYEAWYPVPRQRNGANTCGIHTILNAWAIMLDLTPFDEPEPTPTRATDEEARTLINMALMGQTTLDTIRSFLICKKYAKPEYRGQDEGGFAHAGVQTIAMSERAVRSFVVNGGLRTANPVFAGTY